MDDPDFNVSFSDALKNHFAFTSPSALISFAEMEVKFWREQPQIIFEAFGPNFRPRSLSSAAHSAEVFTRVIASLSRFIEGEDWSYNLVAQFYRELNGELSGLAQRCWISSTNPLAVLWIDSYRHSDATGEAFYQSVVKGVVGSVAFESVKGQILAYEAVMQDESLIEPRRKAEVKTFKAVRSRLLAKTDALIAESDKFREGFKEWLERVQQEAENISDENKRALEVDQSSFRDSHESALQKCDQRLSDMEALLKEKLRMEGPASYWKKSAYKYRCQGLIWTLALIAWAALALGYFREFFLAWADGDRTALNLASLEGAVIFAAIISSFVFMSRVFSRLAFSSFHLQRDAEEREQLTHLYLALSHDLSVDDETRKIVLQSLFSRSETGLLNNESGPTMPGVQDVVSSVIKRGG